MSGDWDTIRPEKQLLSSSEPVQPGKSCASQTQWWDGHRTGIPTPKGRNQKKEKRWRSQASPKPSNQTSPALKAQEESSLVWYSALQAHWGGSPSALDRGPTFDSVKPGPVPKFLGGPVPIVPQDNPTSFPFPPLSLSDHYCLLGGFELDQRSSDHSFKPGAL